MDNELLKKLGLTEGESKIYICLLNLGSSQASKIQENVKLERRSVYDILNKLIEKGLVSYIDENKVRKFKVANPSLLIDYLEDKKSGIEKLKKEVKNQLPEMMSLFNESKSSINSEVFHGEDGIKTVWNDFLNYKEHFWIGSGNYVPDKFPLFYANWTKRRIEKKLKVHHLFRHDKKGHINEFSYQDYRFLPEEFTGNPAAICIWGNKVGHFLFGKELFAFVIESKELSENYNKYFDYLWKIAKK